MAASFSFLNEFLYQASSPRDLEPAFSGTRVLVRRFSPSQVGPVKGMLMAGRHLANGETRMRSVKIALAATALACTTLLPAVGAQAATYHRHVVHHRYGPNPVAAGADVAAGAVNTAGALAFGALNTAGAIASAPFGGGPYYGGGYYAASPWGEYDCRPGHRYECRPYASRDWGYH
jgi:hypothetical protein